MLSPGVGERAWDHGVDEHARSRHERGRGRRPARRRRPPARPRHRLRRLRRLGQRRVVEPAPPDGAPGEGQPRAVRRVARPAPAAAREPRPEADPAAAPARAHAALRPRGPDRALAPGGAGLPAAAGARAQRTAAESPGPPRRAPARHVEPDPLDLRPPRRRARGGPSTVARRLPLRRRHHRGAGHRRRQRGSRRGRIRSASRPGVRELAAPRRSYAHVLDAGDRRPERGRHRDVRARSRATGRSTPRSRRCRGRASSSPGRW